MFRSDQLIDSYYGLKIFLSTKGYLNEFCLAGRYRYTNSHHVHALCGDYRSGLHSAAVYGDAAVLQYRKLDKPLLEAARDLGASKLQTFIRIIIPLTMPGNYCRMSTGDAASDGPVLCVRPDGRCENLLIGNAIKVQFLNIRDWPFGAATSITLTIVMGLMLLVYWRASRLLNKKVELE